MPTANSAYGPGIEGLLFGRVVSKPDFVLLDTLIDKDLDQQNYVVSNATIEAIGFKPLCLFEMRIGMSRTLAMAMSSVLYLGRSLSA